MKKFVLVNHRNNAAQKKGDEITSVEKLGDREKAQTNKQKAVLMRKHALTHSDALWCACKNLNRTVNSVRIELKRMIKELKRKSL